MLTYKETYTVSLTFLEGTDLTNCIFVFFYPLTSSRSGCPGLAVRD